MSNSISDNLQRLQTARSDIAEAITDMGVEVESNAGFEEFPTAIRSISTGGTMSNFYGTCTTAANQQIKSVTISQDQNFELKTGVIIAVLFTYTNEYIPSSGNEIYINVNNTGNNLIKYSTYDAGKLYTAGSAIYGTENRVVYYLYNGSYWLWLNHGADNNTTYSSMSASEASTGTATTGRLISAKVLNDLIASKVGVVKTGTVTYTSNSIIVVSSYSDGTVGQYNTGVQCMHTDGMVILWGNFKVSSTRYLSDIPDDTTLITISGLNLPPNKTCVSMIKAYAAGINYTVPQFDRWVNCSVDTTNNQILIKSKSWWSISQKDQVFGLDGWIYFT